MIQIKDLTAQVTLPNKDVLTTVDRVSLTIDQGLSYAIVGRSGSGKTSLISIIGLLNTAFSGEFYYHGKNVEILSDRARARIRSKEIGFVFQNYSLIRQLSVRDNVALPMTYAKSKMSRRKRLSYVMELLDMVGLKDRAMTMPSRLSGGEQQRVAIARSLACEPGLVICDEPTGALDVDTGTEIMDLLFSTVQERNTSLVLVTHDPQLASRCAKQFHMDAGQMTC